MCGIAGIIGLNDERMEASLLAMTRAQRHRGPDGEGLSFQRYGDLAVGFGHRRLAIQDLSVAGHQPMAASATGNVLIFNGEIYNAPLLRAELQRGGMSFRGNSDTEVLLSALETWGVESIRRLEGMYAFAWLDRAEGSVVIARDPLGIKPLYLSRKGKRLVFASEVKALLASGLVATKLDSEGLASLLAYGSVQAPHTLFEEIGVFPAGHWARVELDAARGYRLSNPVAHWRFPSPEPATDRAAAISRLREQLPDSVSSHLLSDVPVGIFLSSGVDSTLIAALAGRAKSNLHAFTVGFAEDADHNEADLAAETACQFGLSHKTLWLEKDDALNSVLPWLEALDQPSMDGLNTFVISKCVRDAGIVVALSGQGGDELFGGYPSFSDVPRLLRGLRRIDCFPASVKRRLGSALAVRRHESFREKLADLFAVKATVANLALQRRRCFSNGQVESLLQGRVPADLERRQFLAASELSTLPIDARDPIHAISLIELRFYLGNTLLPVGDSNSMAHGLEIRVPMLDRPMLDLALSLPGTVRLPTGQANKQLLKDAFPQYLRPALTVAGKRGFMLPVKRWMKGPLRPVCESALDVIKRDPQFDSYSVDRVWNSFVQSPETPVWSRVWLLVALGHYMAQINRSASSGPGPR